MLEKLEYPEKTTWLEQTTTTLEPYMLEKLEYLGKTKPLGLNRQPVPGNLKKSLIIKLHSAKIPFLTLSVHVIVFAL